MLIEETIQRIVNESVRKILIERLIKVLSKLPNANRIDHIKMSRHFKKDRKDRKHILADLGGFGNPLATFLVFDYDSNSNKLHTITDNGNCIVQDAQTNKIITIFPISFKRLKNYWQQLSGEANPRLPRDVWNATKHMQEYRKGFKDASKALQAQNNDVPNLNKN